MDIQQRDQKSILVVNLGLVANLFLAGVKTVVGVLGHSPALLAEGINSTSDVAYYLVASVFIRLARKPADSEHPYGHRQLESIAALVVGSFVITTAVAIFWDAINKVYDLLVGLTNFDGATPQALWVALGTVAFKLILTAQAQWTGQQTGNPVVTAMAFDHRNDVFSASAAALGIFLGRQGYPWVDPLAGALVALLILQTGISILREASVELMDTVPSEQLERQISECLRDVPGVERVEEMQAHRFGPSLVVNLTICIDGEVSVSAGDEIATQVELTLYRRIDHLRRVHVHYHPCQPPHPVKVPQSEDAAHIPAD
jgi:cation diffusion facilitator family transporter